VLRYKRTTIIQGGKGKRGYHGSEQLQWATPEDQKEIEGKKRKSRSESIMPRFRQIFPKESEESGIQATAKVEKRKERVSQKKQTKGRISVIRN
jgi:hypothetical protein